MKRYYAYAVIDPTKNHDPSPLMMKCDGDMILNIITMRPENGAVLFREKENTEGAPFALTTLILHGKFVHLKLGFGGESYEPPFTEGKLSFIKKYGSRAEAREGYNSLLSEYLLSSSYVICGNGDITLDKTVAQYLKTKFEDLQTDEYCPIIIKKTEW